VKKCFTGCLKLRWFYRHLLPFVVGFYFEMEQNWSIFSTGIKKGFDFTRKPLIYLVAMGGVEPPTLGL
jgi:hypothetical protein